MLLSSAAYEKRRSKQLLYYYCTIILNLPKGKDIFYDVDLLFSRQLYAKINIKFFILGIFVPFNMSQYNSTFSERGLLTYYYILVVHT